MATLEELENGLRKAHAAGNADHARVFAAEIRKMREQPEVNTWDAPVETVRVDPTDGMSRGEQFMAGLGKSIVDTGRGLRQAATDWAGAIAPYYARPMAQERSANLRREADKVRERDAPLMARGAGFAGNVAGVIGQVAVPGIGAIRAQQAAPRAAAAVRSAFLPTSVRGAATQGAAIGSVQQVGTGDSRLANMALGAGAGGAGASIPQGAGALYRMVRGQSPVASGIERRVAETLRSEAADPAALMRAQPSQIPGVQRTLAEEVMDPGIARMERWARGRGNSFDPIDRANNAARVQAIRQFAGDKSDIAAAEAAREASASGLLQKAMRPVDVDVSPVQTAIADALKTSGGRPTVQAAIRDVERAIADAGNNPAGLYNVRKYIGDLLEGKAGADKGYARAASRELIALRDAIDQQVSAAAPEFGQYLAAYRQGSVPINRMQIGQRLISQKSGSTILDQITGEQVLTPARFSQQARNLDQVAQKATGFGKARAADYLTPDDMGTIRAVQDDLERRAFAATAGSGGNSHTAERLALGERVAGGMASRIPLVGQAVGYLREFGQARLEQKLVEVLANPAQARAILAKVPANDRRIIETAIARAGGSLGAMSPALAE